MFVLPLQVNCFATTNSAATAIGGYLRVSFASSGWSPYLNAATVSTGMLQRVFENFNTTGIVTVSLTTLNAGINSYEWCVSSCLPLLLVHA